ARLAVCEHVRSGRDAGRRDTGRTDLGRGAVAELVAIALAVALHRVVVLQRADVIGAGRDALHIGDLLWRGVEHVAPAVRAGVRDRARRIVARDEVLRERADTDLAR